MQRCDFAKWLTCGTQLWWSPANSCTKRIGVPEPDSSQCRPTPSEAVARGTMDSMLEWSRAAWRRHLPTVPDINSFVRELGDGTIHGLAHATAIALPDKVAVRLGDEVITHGELDSLAGRFAASLRINEGDRGLLATPPTLNWLGADLRNPCARRGGGGPHPPPPPRRPLRDASGGGAARVGG